MLLLLHLECDCFLLLFLAQLFFVCLQYIAGNGTCLITPCEGVKHFTIAMVQALCFRAWNFLGLRGFPFSLRVFHKHILSTCTPTSLPLLCPTPFPHKTQKPHPYLTFPTSSLHLWRWFYSFIPLALSWSHPTDSFSYEESKLYSWGDVYLLILFHLLKIFVHIHMVCYFPVLSFEIVLFYGVINEIFIDCIFWLFIFCTKVQFVSLYWSSTLQLSELAHGSPRAFFVVSVWEITPCADVHVSICSCVFWVTHVCRLI